MLEATFAVACLLTVLLGADVYVSVRRSRDALSGEPVYTATVDLADVAIVMFAWTLVLATWRVMP